MPDLGELLGDARRRLTGAALPSPDADAVQLAAHVLGTTPGDVRAAAARGTQVGPNQAAQFAWLVGERAERVPLQHLTGTAPFRTLELSVGPGVFTPRPETEVVAGLAIDEARRLTAPVVVDLCAGSAAIAVAVAVEVPAARVAAVELDVFAIGFATSNVRQFAPHVDLRLGDAVGADTGVLADHAGEVDVVVANPPYIPPGMEPVDPEVAEHEPPMALYGGGDDGLAVPRGVVASAAGLLRPGGLLVLEHADSQGPATRALVAGPGWGDVRTVDDLTGRPRALVARRQ